jgi:hypothetical protein
MRTVIALFVLALLVQNTCPAGWAAKSGLVSSHVHDCPFKQHRPVKHGSDGKVARDFSNAGQYFQLGGWQSGSPDGTLSASEGISPVKEDKYEEAVQDPSFRPPRTARLIAAA